MKYWIIGLLATIAAGSAVYIFTNQESASSAIVSSGDSSETRQVPQMTETAEATQSTGGQYIDYSEEAVAQNSDKKIVIFFHADWCSNCRAIEKTLTAGAIPDDIVILKANYDKETELLKKYGVTQQTAMVQVDGEGNKINLWIANAFDDIDSIKENLI
jgi:thiol:disulfide interchange protein